MQGSWRGEVNVFGSDPTWQQLDMGPQKGTEFRGFEPYHWINVIPRKDRIKESFGGG